jgi:hypothetical protein
MPREPDEDDNLDDDMATDSDDDYDLPDDALDALAQDSGLQIDIVRDLWKAQRGLCRLSDLPMVHTGGLYKCEIAPRKVQQRISHDNAVMVCRVVADMRSVTGMPWRQFVALLRNVTKDDF